MLLIPAIDLKEGQCVRLRQGRMEDDTVFSSDPVAMAARWVEAGARRLHLVDLDGAFAGKPKNREVIRAIAEAFPGHIIVGLDAKDGKVATEGWSKLSHHDVIDMAQHFERDGVEAIIYTDISRDGMMQGVNVEATVRLAQSVRIPVIASGGVTSITDIERLCAVSDEGVAGVVIGRALYEGGLDLAQAQAYVDQHCPD